MNFRERLRDHATPRQWVVDANDGIVATAGVLEGFSGAGASYGTLLLASTVMVIAGSLSVGGAKWAEDAGDLEAERRIIEDETAQLASDPDAEKAELTAYWIGKGLTPEVAEQAAEQLTARDALAAHLEYEHDIDEPTPKWQPVWAGVTTGLAFLLGSLIPLLVIRFLPLQVESLALLVTVVVSLAITSFVGARTGHMSTARTIMRSVTVGIGTLVISYLAGMLLF